MHQKYYKVFCEGGIHLSSDSKILLSDLLFHFHYFIFRFLLDPHQLFRKIKSSVKIDYFNSLLKSITKNELILEQILKLEKNFTELFDESHATFENTCKRYHTHILFQR